MKPLNASALAALAANEGVIAGAARFDFPSGPYRLWSGIGQLALGTEGTFDGIGARALLVPIASGTGGAADGLVLSLSGLETAVAQTIEEEDYHQKPVVIWRAVFDAPGVTLLHYAVFYRGRVDTVLIRETRRGESTIDIVVEGSARDMSRAGARRRSDADQRVLYGATDAFFRNASTVPQKTLSWGGKPSTAGQVVSGGGSTTTSAKNSWGTSAPQ
jgi:hypothetical protein